MPVHVCVQCVCMCVCVWVSVVLCECLCMCVSVHESVCLCVFSCSNGRSSVTWSQCFSDSTRSKHLPLPAVVQAQIVADNLLLNFLWWQIRIEPRTSAVRGERFTTAPPDWDRTQVAAVRGERFTTAPPGWDRTQDLSSERRAVYHCATRLGSNPGLQQ